MIIDYASKLCIQAAGNWTGAVKGYMLVTGLKNLLAIPNVSRRLAIEVETILLERKN